MKFFWFFFHTRSVILFHQNFTAMGPKFRVFNFTSSKRNTFEKKIYFHFEKEKRTKTGQKKKNLPLCNYSRPQSSKPLIVKTPEIHFRFQVSFKFQVCNACGDLLVWKNISRGCGCNLTLNPDLHPGGEIDIYVHTCCFWSWFKIKSCT